MMETHIYFKSDENMLEGVLQSHENKNNVKKGVVIAHPHPLYGGSMDVPVVTALASVFYEHGYDTLRFNFRGTGRSEGAYDNGEGEVEDVKAAYAYMAEKGVKQIDLAGYSFGARMISGLSHTDYPDSKLYLISPPVNLMDFSGVEEMPHLSLVVTGSLDETASPSLIKEYLPVWNKRAVFEIIDGADHFYGAYLGELKRLLDTALSKING